MPSPPFSGNCGGNVSKDAKYVVRHHGAGQFRIALLYRADGGETWHVSTQAHPELAKMVNRVKEEVARAPAGAFYINEYRQVIVPASDGESERKMYYAGEYATQLEFQFEGKRVSTQPRDLTGRTLKPGDKWMGPRVAIKYTLAAGGNDIRYESNPRPEVTKRVSLVDSIGAMVAMPMLDMIHAHKRDGGAVYVNDSLAVFVPLTLSSPMEYVYCGQLDLARWFPKPDMGSTESADESIRI